MSTSRPEADKQSGPRSRKGALTRTRLIDAAKVVFGRDGFLEARISDIAEEADLSHGSFYHYFESKEQIFREVADAVQEKLQAPVDVIFDPTSTATPRERMREGIRRFLQSYQQEALLMACIEQVSRYDEHVLEVRLRRSRPQDVRIAESIRQLQTRGLAAAEVDPVFASAALGGMISRLAETWLVEGRYEFDLDSAADQLSLLFANACGFREVSGTSITRRRVPTD